MGIDFYMPLLPQCGMPQCASRWHYRGLTHCTVRTTLQPSIKDEHSEIKGPVAFLRNVIFLQLLEISHHVHLPSLFSQNPGLQVLTQM